METVPHCQNGADALQYKYKKVLRCASVSFGFEPYHDMRESYIRLWMASLLDRTSEAALRIPTCESGFVKQLRRRHGGNARTKPPVTGGFFIYFAVLLFLLFWHEATTGWKEL